MKITTRKLEIFLIEEQIICVRPVIADAEFDVDDGRDMAHAFDALAGGKPFASLLDIYETAATVTSELRKFGAGKHYKSPQAARAVLQNSLVHKLITNHFINTFHPSVQTKFFDLKEKALDWLRGKLKEYEAGKE
ncbi:MAG: hypothetical protein FD123_93 [Bacteroidetes bacterium]|nr:MAG: hypothetical protein FD123_93 [Bacteroidota bacterium]